MIGLDFGLGALEQDMWRVVFLMTRLGAALLAAPFFGASAVPVAVRVAMTGALAIFVSIWMPNVQTPEALLSAEEIEALRDVSATKSEAATSDSGVPLDLGKKEPSA